MKKISSIPLALRQSKGLKNCLSLCWWFCFKEELPKRQPIKQLKCWKFIFFPRVIAFDVVSCIWDSHCAITQLFTTATNGAINKVSAVMRCQVFHVCAPVRDCVTVTHTDCTVYPLNGLRNVSWYVTSHSLCSKGETRVKLFVLWAVFLSRLFSWKLWYQLRHELEAFLPWLAWLWCWWKMMTYIWQQCWNGMIAKIIPTALWLAGIIYE